MSIGEKTLVVVAIMILALCGIVGMAPNVAAAYDYDNGIDLVTVTFNDTMAVNMTDGMVYNATVNQTSISLFYIYSNFVYDYNPNTSYVRMWVVIITDPSGEKTFLYPESYGSWLLEPVGDTYCLQGPARTDAVNDTYALSEKGAYRVHVEKWLIINGTGAVEDNLDFRINYGIVDPANTKLGMGDWAWLEMTLGFVGVLGFVATPMVTAKLMSSKDPITLMSAFMICMIMFGTFIYVFLLGGS